MKPVTSAAAYALLLAVASINSIHGSQSHNLPTTPSSLHGNNRHIYKQPVEQGPMHARSEEGSNVPMLRVQCRVGNNHIHAFVDTGAQVTVMSMACAQRCGLMSLVDQSFAGDAKGVGSTRILGRIEGVEMYMGSPSDSVRLEAVNVMVLEDLDLDMLIGMDLLRQGDCEIRLLDNVLRYHTGHPGALGTPTPSPAATPPAAASSFQESSRLHSSKPPGRKITAAAMRGALRTSVRTGQVIGGSPGWSRRHSLGSSSDGSGGSSGHYSSGRGGDNGELAYVDVPFLDQEQVQAVRVSAMQRAEQFAADERARHVDRQCRPPGTPASYTRSSSSCSASPVSARAALSSTSQLPSQGSFELKPFANPAAAPGAATATLMDSAAAIAARQDAASQKRRERKQARRAARVERTAAYAGAPGDLRDGAPPPPGAKRAPFNPAAEASRRAAALEFMKRHKSNEAAAEAARLADASFQCNLAATFDSDSDDRDVEGM